MGRSGALFVLVGAVVLGGCSRRLAQVQPRAPIATALGVSAPVAGALPSSTVQADKPAPHEPAKEMVVAWDASLLYLLEDGKLVGRPMILNDSMYSMLRPKHLGDFRISEKMREWRSNLYDIYGDPLPDRSLAATRGAVMKNWMRLGDLGVGLHFSLWYHPYKRPADRHRSHGCYRMGKVDSRRVWNWAPVGTPIHVVRSLAGTRWAFLRDQTPAELLHGPRAEARARAHKRGRAMHGRA